MSKKVIVLEGQSIPDIAIQELGSIEGALDIALFNDISITDELTVGQEIIIPDQVVDSNVANYFEQRNTKIVSGENVIL